VRWSRQRSSAHPRQVRRGPARSSRPRTTPTAPCPHHRGVRRFENENLLLIEGKISTPATRQLRPAELQFIEGVDNVYSFRLRHPPDANGDAALVVDNASAGLTPQLVGDPRPSADGREARPMPTR
jgi:hypothetical protein